MRSQARTTMSGWCHVTESLETLSAAAKRAFAEQWPTFLAGPGCHRGGEPGSRRVCGAVRVAWVRRAASRVIRGECAPSGACRHALLKLRRSLEQGLPSCRPTAEVTWTAAAGSVCREVAGSCRLVR